MNFITDAAERGRPFHLTEGIYSTSLYTVYTLYAHVFMHFVKYQTS